MAGYLPNGCITFIPRSLGVCQVELGTNFERIPSDNYSQFVLEKTIYNIYIYVCVYVFTDIVSTKSLNSMGHGLGFHI
jgi:hypothetical protein